MTKMLISIVILYVVYNLLVPSMMAGHFGFEPEHMMRSEDMLLGELLTMQLLLVNSAANFIIYFGMGTKFLSECIKFFSELLSCWRSINTTTTASPQTNRDDKYN